MFLEIQNILCGVHLPAGVFKRYIFKLANWNALHISIFVFVICSKLVHFPTIVGFYNSM